MPIENVNVPGLADLPYYLLAFDAGGRERAEAGGELSRRIIDVLAQEPVTDVFLMSHGWMGDIPAASRQYHQWIGAMAANQADIARLRERRPGFRPLLIGLHWPSLPWGDEELAAAALAFGTTAAPVEPLIEQYAERLADTEPARRALQTILQAALEDSGAKELPAEVRDAYAVLDREAALSSDGEGGAPGADREPFDPQALFEAAEDDAVSFGSLSGLSSGLLAPLRALSFWKMKDRARRFGERGGFELLTALQRAADPAVHFHGRIR
jgi:hypothetical protein